MKTHTVQDYQLCWFRFADKCQNSGYTTVSYHHAEVDDESYTMNLNKIKNAHRAVSIFSDPKGDNFAILQVLYRFTYGYYFYNVFVITNTFIVRSNDQQILWIVRRT